MHRILCVEDSNETLEILSTILEEHHLVIAKTVQDATKYLKKEAFSLIILDVELPDGNGFEILASAQSKMENTSIICLTGKSDFASKVSAFTLGVDDFVQKPFHPQELKLRIESKLRKISKSKEQGQAIRFGDLVCSPQEQRLRRNIDNKIIDLTSHEFRIYHLLVLTPNKVFTREEILDRVWTDSVKVADRVVDVHVSNLRRKLNGTKVGVETIVGTGYRIQLNENAGV